jgi:hypothetical protein
MKMRPKLLKIPPVREFLFTEKLAKMIPQLIQKLFTELRKDQFKIACLIVKMLMWRSGHMHLIKNFGLKMLILN